MLNASMLVVYFLTHLIQIKWVSATPTSKVDLCLRLPSWHGWKKLFKIIANCILLPITFLINLPIVLSKIIG